MPKNRQQTPALDSFDIRAQSYSDERVAIFNQANRQQPEVRESERQHVIQRLYLEPDMTVCDVGAGGGYLAEGIYDAMAGRVKIICVENSESFLDSIDPRFSKVLSSLCRIELPDESVDRVSCLAGLHHQEKKLEFCIEAYRLLKNEGVVCVGDVLKDSPPASFLNISVDRYSDMGHDGMFLVRGELTELLDEAGFTDLQEHYEEYSWDFDGWETMAQYCKTLFRMQHATLKQVKEEIREYLEVSESNSGVHLHWSLVYATGRKS